MSLQDLPDGLQPGRGVSLGFHARGEVHQAVGHDRDVILGSLGIPLRRVLGKLLVILGYLLHYGGDLPDGV